MKHYQIAATLPLTLFVDVDADNEQEAIEMAKGIVAETPLEDFAYDTDCVNYDIVKED